MREVNFELEEVKKDNEYRITDEDLIIEEILGREGGGASLE